MDLTLPLILHHSTNVINLNTDIIVILYLGFYFLVYIICNQYEVQPFVYMLCID